MWSNQRPNRVFGTMMTLSVRCRTTAKTLGTIPGDKDLLDRFIASKAPDAFSTAEELANTYLPVPGEVPMEEKEKLITVFPKGKFFKKVDEPVFYDPIMAGDIIPEGVEVVEVILPYIWDYQLRGSFKESIAFIQRASKPKAAKAKTDADATAETEASDAPKKRGRKKAEDAAAAALDEAIENNKKFACSDIKAYKKDVDGGWLILQRRIPILVPETYVDEMGVTRNTYDENGRLPTWTRPLRADTAQGPRVCLATSEFVPAGSEYYFTVGLLNAKNRDALIECLDFKEKIGMLQWRGGGNGTFIWTPADRDGHPVDIEL